MLQAMTGADSILIIKLSSVGDVVQATPVVRHLKQVTGARIVWLVDEGIAPLLEGHPDVDELICFPRNPFLPRGGLVPDFLPKLKRVARQLRRREFDLAIDLQGRGRTYALLQLARARRKIGRGRFPFLEEKVPRRRSLECHAVESYFEASDLLGYPRPIDPRPVLPEAVEDIPKIERVLRQQRVGERFVCLLPATTWPSRHWPTTCWARVADWLTGEGYDVLLLGTEREAALGAEIARNLRQPQRLFPFFGSGAPRGDAESFGLRELIPLFRRSSLVVGSDTGPAHIAAAAGVPIVALFGPTDPALTAPRPAERVTAITAPECHHCHRYRCVRRCLSRIRPETVIAAIGAQLSTARGGASGPVSGLT